MNERFWQYFKLMFFCNFIFILNFIATRQNWFCILFELLHFDQMFLMVVFGFINPQAKNLKSFKGFSSEA